MLQHPSVKSLWDDDPPTYEDVLSARRAAALQAGTADNLTEAEYRSIPPLYQPKYVHLRTGGSQWNPVFTYVLKTPAERHWAAGLQGMCRDRSGS
jgi:hypothetical protein